MSDQWKRFTTLYLIQFLQLLDFISISPTGALFVSSHQIKSSTISYSLSAYSVFAIIGSVLVARFRQHSPRVNLMVLVSLFGISQLMLLLSVTDTSFIWSRALGGLTGGLMGSIAYSQLSNVDVGNQGLWNGRIQTAQSMVTLIGLPACLLLITSYGSKVFFSSMFILALLVLFNLYFCRFLKSTGGSRSTAFSKKVFTSHGDIIITGFIVYFASFLFISQMPNYLINFRGIPAGNLSIAYSLSGIITILFSGMIGKLGDKNNSKFLLALFSSLIIIAQVIFFDRFNSFLTLFVGLPLYLFLSTGRAIHQRGIILQNRTEDSFSMHLINNIAIRAGILASGLALGIISSQNRDISEVFKIANFSSIICGLVLSISLFITIYSKSIKARG